MGMANVPSHVRLVDDEITALKLTIGREAPARAARRLGVDRHTMLRAVAGYGIRSGTATQIRLALLASSREPRP